MATASKSMFCCRESVGVRSLKGAPCRWRVVRAESTSSSSPINPSIKKDEPKVVDTVLVSDLQKPLQPYCRCWRSKTFPLCDGSHAKHNKETGDNVGPLLLKK